LASTNLGRVGFVLKGEWSSSAAYVPLDVVYYNGYSYAAIVNSSGQTPPNIAYWQPIGVGTGVITRVDEILNGAAVRYDRVQELSAEQKTQARTNIGAAATITVDQTTLVIP